MFHVFPVWHTPFIGVDVEIFLINWTSFTTGIKNDKGQSRLLCQNGHVVPGPLYRERAIYVRSSTFQSLYKRGELGIFSSHGALVGEKLGDFSKSPGLITGEQVRIFPSPTVYIRRELEILVCPRVYI